MCTPWFFLSYFRTGNADSDRHVKKFYDDLIGQMRELRGELKGLSDSDVGFIDVKTIRAGANWRWVLAKELWNSRVLICLYSDGYFFSEECGKEFYTFRSRFPIGDGEMLSQSILPILWSRHDMLPKLPSAVEGNRRPSYHAGHEPRAKRQSH
jgi:TIR domain